MLTGAGENVNLGTNDLINKWEMTNCSSFLFSK
jgi:hypothetical protein